MDTWWACPHWKQMNLYSPTVWLSIMTSVNLCHRKDQIHEKKFRTVSILKQCVTTCVRLMKGWQRRHVAVIIIFLFLWALLSNNLSAGCGLGFMLRSRVNPSHSRSICFLRPAGSVDKHTHVQLSHTNTHTPACRLHSHWGHFQVWLSLVWGSEAGRLKRSSRVSGLFLNASRLCDCVFVVNDVIMCSMFITVTTRIWIQTL